MVPHSGARLYSLDESFHPASSSAPYLSNSTINSGLFAVHLGSLLSILRTPVLWINMWLRQKTRGKRLYGGVALHSSGKANRRRVAADFGSIIDANPSLLVIHSGQVFLRDLPEHRWSYALAKHEQSWDLLLNVSYDSSRRNFSSY